MQDNDNQEFTLEDYLSSLRDDNDVMYCNGVFIEEEGSKIHIIHHEKIDRGYYILATFQRRFMTSEILKTFINSL